MSTIPQILPLLLTLILRSLFCVAEIITDLDVLSRRSFDFVIVGAGAGGSVIANRLTENPHVSVLLIEAGGSNEGVLNSSVPGLVNFLPNSAWDWNFTSTAQSFLNNRTVPVARGFILGGTTSINQMAYTRGSSEDYDRWAKITRDKGWSWDRLQKYILRNERFTEPVDHHNTTGQFDPSVHGFHGINSVSLQGFPTVLDNRTVQATAELSKEFPFNLDMNSGNQLGIGWVQATIGNGTRSSSATSYLGPQFTKRSNLHIMLNTRVLRILQTEKQEKCFQTVEFSQDAGKTKHTITASKEVILSAGAIMTPHILLHSGIGDSKQLSTLGIKTVHHLPSVGRNLTDQPIVRNNGLSTPPRQTIARNDTLLAELTQQWEESKSGPLVDPPLSFIGWLRLPDNASIFEQVPDPSAGPNTSHYELIISNGALAHPAPATGNFMTFSTSVASVTSRGSITLNTSDPFAHPLINFNLLGTEFDRFTIREAFRSSKRFLTAQSWDGYVLAPPTNATTDEELDEYISANAATENHPVGTAAMSSKDAAYGVVDPDLCVKGITGLRIVDASIFPMLPAAHTQVPVYIVAERAADLIKSSW